MVHFCNYSFINKSYSFLKKKKIEVYAQGPVYKTQVHRRKKREGTPFWIPPRFISCFLFLIVKLYVHVCIGFVYMISSFIHVL